ncbi:hypothetical protein HMPREF1986_01198 [Oribacterium sp. oral taxon 078 str. F0263]|nr:hypothetical protein HMPREF1986_01198 [Oribacterium sp. oral taxon 078 str. F0263]
MTDPLCISPRGSGGACLGSAAHFLLSDKALKLLPGKFRKSSY